MSSPLSRPLATILTVVLSLNLACASGLRPVPRNEIEEPNEAGIEGVTTHAGERIMFDVPKSNPAHGGRSTLAVIPHVRGDSLFAAVQGEPVRLAVEDVQAYWVNPPSVGRTALVAGAVAVVAVMVAAIVAVSSWSSDMTL